MRIFLFYIALLFCLPLTAHASFNISLESRCFDTTLSNYFFSGSYNNPDYRVKVSKTAYPYDIAFELVQEKSEADLVFVESGSGDEQNSVQFSNNSDIRICKKLTPVNAQIIQVSRSDPSPQITVKIGEYVLNKDYKLFVQSKRIKADQAAALFAILWHEDRERFLELLE